MPNQTLWFTIAASCFAFTCQAQIVFDMPPPPSSQGQLSSTHKEGWEVTLTAGGSSPGVTMYLHDAVTGPRALTAHLYAGDGNPSTTLGAAEQPLASVEIMTPDLGSSRDNETAVLFPFFGFSSCPSNIIFAFEIRRADDPHGPNTSVSYGMTNNAFPSVGTFHTRQVRFAGQDWRTFGTTRVLASVEMGISVQEADLHLTRTATAGTVPAGTELSYDLEVTNLGTATAADVVLTDTLPVGVKFVSATGGNCTVVNNVVTCALGSVGAGASMTVPVTVRMAVEGEFTTVAEASTSTTDSVPSNNTVTTVTTVTPPVDSDMDGMPDWWEIANLPGGIAGMPDADGDGDGSTNREEFIFDTDPRDPSDGVHLEVIVSGLSFDLAFDTSPIRVYEIEALSGDAGVWAILTGAEIPGTGGEMTVNDSEGAPHRLYRLRVSEP